jgi:hypothetical protein
MAITKNLNLTLNSIYFKASIQSDLKIIALKIFNLN